MRHILLLQSLAIRVLLVPIALLTLVVSPVFAAESEAKQAVGGPEWKTRMQGMLGDVASLIPLAFSQSTSIEPAQVRKQDQALASLIQHAQGLKKQASSNHADPSFSFIADAFESDLSLAQSDFKVGPDYREPGRARLRSAFSKCVMCHSQSSIGPEFKMDALNSGMKELSTPDRIMALAATRQFDEALAQFDQYVRDAKAVKPSQEDFDRSVRSALSIIVRVKDDPIKTENLIDKTIASEAGTRVLQADLPAWKKAAQLWHSEKRPSLSTDQQLFDEAKRLVAAAQVSSIDTYKSPSIDLLRASARLHDLLARFPKSHLRAESYLLLASVYDALPGFSVWDLSDEYLSACIRENPHSEIGERCYDHYTESVTLGYTGSAGTHVPKAVQQHLETMRALASRATHKPSPKSAQPTKEKR